MANLITVTEFATFRSISEKKDEAKIEDIISKAQKSDLNSILGDFYFDVVKNANESSYQDLMNGSTFEYCDEEFEHDGIKALLADYAHARYIYEKPVNDTSFGFMYKQSQDGVQVDRNMLKDMQKQDQIDAGNKFRIIEKYILSKPELFDRYCKSKKSGSEPFAQQRFSKL